MRESLPGRVRGYMANLSKFAGLGIVEDFRVRLLTLITNPSESAEEDFLRLQEEIQRETAQLGEANVRAAFSFSINDRIMTAKYGPGTVTDIVRAESMDIQTWQLVVLFDGGHTVRANVSSLRPKKMGQLEADEKARFDCEEAFGTYVRRHEVETYEADLSPYIAFVDHMLAIPDFVSECAAAADRVRERFADAQNVEAELTSRIRNLLIGKVKGKTKTKQKGDATFGLSGRRFLHELRKKLWELRRDVKDEQDYAGVRERAAIVVLHTFLFEESGHLANDIHMARKAKDDLEEERP